MLIFTFTHWRSQPSPGRLPALLWVNGGVAGLLSPPSGRASEFVPKRKNDMRPDDDEKLGRSGAGSNPFKA